MFLFLISLILILLSSYLITSIFEQKSARGIVYFFLLTFSQIILNFEILSIFNSIAKLPFIALNLICFVLSVLFWNKNSRPIFKPDIKDLFKTIFKSIKKDKLLLISFAAILFFIAVNLILSVISPIHISDAMAYHVPRAIRWIINGNLLHFPTTDMRMLTMPINSELFYAYMILFFRSDVLLSMLAFTGYVNAIIVIWAFLGDLGFCARKKLWTIFIFSALPFVLAETSSQDTNLFLGSMLLTVIYLFHSSLKTKNNAALYFSSLAFAISFGVKTTALIAAPSVFITLCYIAFLYEKKQFYKPIIKFSLFCFLNFIIFSAYNYILNYINYSDFVTTQEQYELNKFRGGKKAYCSNLIKYGFLFFDFAGIPYMEVFRDFFKYLNEAFHALIGITPKTYASVWFKYSEVNTTLLETRVGLGLLGCFAFLPSIIISFFTLKSKVFKNKKSVLLFLALSYIFNLLLFARLMIFTNFNNRYFMTFTMISVPALVYTYSKSWKNVYKWLLVIIASYYLFYVSTHISFRNMTNILKELKHNHCNIKALRDKMRCQIVFAEPNEACNCRSTNILKEEGKNVKVAYFASYGDFLYNYEYLNLHGYHIDYLLFEEFDKYNISDYDIILVHPTTQMTHTITNYDNTKRKYKIENNYLIYDKNAFVECYYYDYRSAYVTENNTNPPIFSSCFTPYENIMKLGYKFYKYVPYSTYQQLQKTQKDKENSEDIFMFKK